MKWLVELSVLIVLLAASCATQPSLVGSREGSGELRGMVYDLDRQPVPDAIVAWNGGKSPVSATTDIHGRFSLGDVPFGAQKLQIAKDGSETLYWTLNFVDTAQVIYAQLASQDQLFARAADAIDRKDWKECDTLLDRADRIAPGTLQWVVLKATSLEGQGKGEEGRALLATSAVTAPLVAGKPEMRSIQP